MGVKNAQEIFGGAAMLLYAETGTAKPSQIADIINGEDGTLAAGWHSFGATDGGLSEKKSFEKEEWEVDQVLAPIEETITKHTMALETALAEPSLENIKIVYGGGTITVDGATGERKIGYGSPVSIPGTMIAFLLDTKKGIQAHVFWIAKWNGSEISRDFKKGEKSLLPLSLSLLADTTEPESTTFGIIIEEA